MNKVLLTGRITADPELQEYGKGKNKGTYLNFCIAVYRNADHTDFIYCTAFNKTAEYIVDKVEKGNRLTVEGYLAQDTFEKDGESRTSYNVNVNSVELIDFN